MTDFDNRLMDIAPREPAVTRFRPLSWLVVPLLAIWFQVFVHRFVGYVSYLELPLLVTIYFSMMRRQPIIGSVFGACVGLAQDSLSDHYVGMFGIVKTMVGFIAASLSLRFDVDSPLLRLTVTYALFVFHQMGYWAVAKFLVGQSVDLQLPQMAIQGFLNALIAIPFYLVLDRLKEEAR
ncbi:MAG: rod shape-determining protein MreD [Bryobacterales bacterium]|nr:rod shape-determining protein MreD [Bryobacterales bacterium]